MQKVIVTIFCFLLFGNVSGQDVKGKLINDRYSGVITDHGKNVAILLLLHHQRYGDDGKFTLTETADGKTNEMTGDWTVLRGDAGDENATVVELDGAGRTLYFLRRKDGRLQKLDTALRAILPVKGNLLTIEKASPKH